MGETIRIECKGSATKDLSQLEDFQGDLKRLSKENANRLRNEIKTLGFSEPVSVWQHEGRCYILNGHQRVAVLRQMAAEGFEIPALPVSVVEATSIAEAKRKVLALTSQYGEITSDGLSSFLEDAQISLEEAMESFRFPEVDLALLAGPESDAFQDTPPEPPPEPITQPSEVIELGGHVLMCGDSANDADVDRLLGGEAVHLVNTDPPYNVKVEPRTGTAMAAGNSSALPRLTHHQSFDKARGRMSQPKARMRARDRVLTNDFLPPEQFDELVRKWFGNLARALLPGRSFYVWGGYANIFNFPRALEQTDLYFSQAVVWVKGHPVLTRKDFMGDHEWCFYGWRKGAGHYFNPEIHNATDVWSVKKVNPASMVHLTEKPVELAARAMKYSSRAGERVLDLFGGSGSTLVAAEQMGRKALLMEIDPLYCDVIVSRYHNLAGWDKAPKEHRERWEPREEEDNGSKGTRKDTDEVAQDERVVVG